MKINIYVNKYEKYENISIRSSKMLKSKLSDYNKLITHNSFAASIVLATGGIIDWTAYGIEKMSLKQRRYGQ